MWVRIIKHSSIPAPELLTKNFCLDPSLEQKLSPRSTSCQTKNCSHCNITLLAKGKQVPFVRIHFPQPNFETQIENHQTLGVGVESIGFG